MQTVDDYKHMHDIGITSETTNAFLTKKFKSSYNE